MVVWKASAQAGLILTTGNSNGLSVSGAANASRNDGTNKITLDVAGAYARSTVLTPTAAAVAANVIASPSDIAHVTSTTAANVLGKFRYDRFFTENNSIYGDVFAGLDDPAGKNLFVGGQAGYRRQIYNSERNLLAVEVGYDFTYTDYADPKQAYVILHSARLYAGYNLTLTKDTALTTSFETLVNFNSADVAGIHYGFGAATRFTGKTALTTKLYKNISFRFSFTARYDNAPGELPALSVPYATGPMAFTPLADKLDTITEAGLVVTFL